MFTIPEKKNNLVKCHHLIPAEDVCIEIPHSIGQKLLYVFDCLNHIIVTYLARSDCFPGRM